MSLSCLSSIEPFFIYFEGRCTYQHFLGRLNLELGRDSPSCPHDASRELQLLLGLSSEAEARSHIESSCQVAFDNQYQMAWEDVTRKLHDQPLFDSIYYNGGGLWNEYYETGVNNRVPYVDQRFAQVLKHDASRIDDVYEAYAREQKVEYVDAVVDNFADCPLRAAMCCFASDRQANDNNGNCAKPYDTNCVDADPADNTDLCYVDMSRDKSAPGTDGGFALYPGDNADGEGSIHCHGLAWSNNENDPESRYKGNNIFYVSMYDHLYTRGYVRNVPGAPKCGCLDRMPVVSRSDCTQVDVIELWFAAFTPASNGTDAASFSLDLDPENGVNIKFNACRGARRNNDLESYYHRLFNEGRASIQELTEVRQTLVGNNNCQKKIDEFVVTQGFEKI
eukprot:CAMPEP_0172534068 /NCGR_PEP_ID=MMETSP1067-20121228/6567_1 /TAXON_ID=265564 ORGANISM="Thalassiosira punctigera, Strain Tpunct2005C2" /NCGR_SAMPLE_ID=MMETSP1067 /ASSEMBLY_ACC=CAM_ASM_000444 /LENGTH=392 /DNA_ID=CAMNT_0013318807 /DNA_START=59 /DNA_END=1237 /DNA_ORIENTATION=+